jgi:hypothetical protein
MESQPLDRYSDGLGAGRTGFDFQRMQDSVLYSTAFSLMAAPFEYGDEFSCNTIRGTSWANEKLSASQGILYFM